MQKLQSGWGSAPDPDGGAYSAPPYPLAGREGATPPPAPTPALNQFHLIAFPNPPVSRPAYGPASVTHVPFRAKPGRKVTHESEYPFFFDASVRMKQRREEHNTRFVHAVQVPDDN